MHSIQEIARKTIINVRPAFFYTKAYLYNNSVAICLTMIKLVYHTVYGPSIYCLKFQGWMRRTF